MAPTREPRVVALAGQPNCGKSTLFNAVAGFRVDTGNFPGTSVAFAETALRVGGQPIRLIDLPGTYSISSHDPAERVARDFLLSGEVDLIVNVVDASLLSRSLELTLQLIEMEIPVILCLNMMDEARRKGIDIDADRLAHALGVAISPVVAIRGTGIEALFRQVLAVDQGPYQPVQPRYDRDVEECLGRLATRYPAALRSSLPMPDRFVALRLLEMDEDLERRAQAAAPEFVATAQRERRQLAELHGWSEAGVLASHRHALVLDVYEQVATHRRRRPGRREAIDRWVTTPLGGLATVVASSVLAFYLAYYCGNALSGWIESPFRYLRQAIAGLDAGLPAALLLGVAEGVIAGAGIVLPYLVPLLLLLALYEDTGILPRVAFMVDGLLHRAGMHGKSVVPLILGYGCNVPAVMATRNLENPRDRLITMLVIPFTTCSARSVIILALGARYLGGAWTAGLYLGGMVVAVAVAFAVSRRGRRDCLGLVMEVPPLRPPVLAVTARKVWFRLRDFLLLAWPIIVVSSVVLAALSYYGIDAWVNRLLEPLTTGALGLPAATGIALFLGVFRKELALVMLAAALGTEDIGAVLTPGQLLTLVVFTMLYIPCVATLATLWREGGWRTCAASALLNLTVALAVGAFLARLPLF